jgi:hypothetical protein
MDQDMLNENPGNRNWKDKLDDTDSLSSATLTDKNAAWEKLHSRLHRQPRRSRAIWYWAAAACILIAIIAPLLTTDKKQAELVTNNTLPVTTNKASVPQQLPVQENVSTVVPAVDNSNTVTIQKDQPVNHKKVITGNAPVQPAIDPVLFIEQKNMLATQTITVSPVQIPVTETTTVAVTVKKKLKVVHINELGDPVSAPRNMVHPDEYSVIQFRLINQQVYTSSPVPSTSIGFNISSSKNVPSN